MEEGSAVSDISRREALALVAGIPLAAATQWLPSSERAVQIWALLRDAARAREPFEPRFFTPHEWRTVGTLADTVIPRDERSGSASDAGVPQFIDFMMVDRPRNQPAMRAGLRWLDEESMRRSGEPFIDCGQDERAAILDDIAWPARARPEMAEGVAFFTAFRDLTASGFWSSRMGVKDLHYEGNTVVAEWRGCPEAALRKLGVRYEEAS